MKDIFYTHRRQICSDLGNMDEPDRVGSVDFTIWVSISSLKQQAKFKINCIKRLVQGNLLLQYKDDLPGLFKRIVESNYPGMVKGIHDVNLALKLLLLTGSRFD